LKRRGKEKKKLLKGEKRSGPAGNSRSRLKGEKCFSMEHGLGQGKEKKMKRGNVRGGEKRVFEKRKKKKKPN